MQTFTLHLSALVLFLLASMTSAADPPSPRANLTYTGQTQRGSAYTLTGFPGCAVPGNDIIATFSDGNQEVVAKVNEDGSFALKVPYETGRKGIAMKAQDAHGNVSLGIPARLDYPLFGRVDGWVRFTSAAIDVDQDLQERDEIKVAWRAWKENYDRMVKRWLERIGQTTLLKAVEEGFVLPDSLETPIPGPPQNSWERALEKTTPEDIKVYGYTPEGDTATCIMGANGRSFSSPIREDRRFTLVIPYEAVEPSRGDLATFLINVTDAENRLLVAHATNPGVPRWAHERLRTKERESLIGHLAPDFTLGLITEEGSVRLSALKGQNVLINLWATWCGPCLRELPHIQELFSELDRSKWHVLSINRDRDNKKAQDFLTKEGYTFPVLSDTTRTMWKLYKAYGLPMTIIIDRDRIIRHIEDGYLSKESILTILADTSID